MTWHVRGRLVVLARLTPSTPLEFFNQLQLQSLPLERLQSGPGLRERFFAKPKSIYPGSGSRAGLLCVVGVIPFTRAPSPKTEHTEGADPKTELKKLNTALRLVCWSVSLLFCRVSFLVGVLPLGPRLCLSAMGFRDAFFQRKGDDPRTDHFRQVLLYQARLCYVMAARLRSIGYAIFCEAVPCAIGNSGQQVPLSSTSSLGTGSCGLLFLRSMKATVFMCVAALFCREISGFSSLLTSKRSRRKDISQVVLHSQWLQVTPIPKTGHAKQEPSLE